MMMTTEPSRRVKENMAEVKEKIESGIDGMIVTEVDMATFLKKYPFDLSSVKEYLKNATKPNSKIRWLEFFLNVYHYILKFIAIAQKVRVTKKIENRLTGLKEFCIGLITKRFDSFFVEYNVAHSRGDGRTDTMKRIEEIYHRETGIEVRETKSKGKAETEKVKKELLWEQLSETERASILPIFESLAGKRGLEPAQLLQQIVILAPDDAVCDREPKEESVTSKSKCSVSDEVDDQVVMELCDGVANHASVPVVIDPSSSSSSEVRSEKSVAPFDVTYVNRFEAVEDPSSSEDEDDGRGGTSRSEVESMSNPAPLCSVECLPSALCSVQSTDLGVIVERRWLVFQNSESRCNVILSCPNCVGYRLALLVNPSEVYIRVDDSNSGPIVFHPS